MIKARDRSGEVALSEQRIEVTPGQNPGYIRRQAGSKRYFAFNSGAPYFPIGENICWPRANRQLGEYADYFAKLGQAGGNFARIWLVNWNFGLEWSEQSPERRSMGLYYGLGRYSLDNAWRLDRLLELAEKNGIYLMLCLGYHGEVSDRADYFGSSYWYLNPYNQENGGPCVGPEDFWTNESARRLYRQKLRYYLARYAYHTHIQSFEFWNETNPPTAWIDEMGRYVKAGDPFGHLLTTTYGTPEIWSLPVMDFAQIHTYGSDGELKDSTLNVVMSCQAYPEKYGKPFLVGEFGIDFKRPDLPYDPNGKGINLHNGQWASLMSGGAGTAMVWWWDSYIEPKNLYGSFSTVSAFLAGENWGGRELRPLKAKVMLPRKPMAEPRRVDYAVECLAGWEGSQKINVSPRFVILASGAIEGGPIMKYLFGRDKLDFRVNPVFEVDYPAAGRFSLRVDTVSESPQRKARLLISLDDALALDEQLPVGPAGTGEWKKSEFNAQWNKYRCQYDRDFSIQVPAGKHRIQVENAGGDWLTLSQVFLEKYVDADQLRMQDVQTYGLSDGEMAVLWLKDTNSNWYQELNGGPIGPWRGVEVALPEMKPGAYAVEWWNTWTGKVMSTERRQAPAGELILRVPDFERDLAVKIKPMARSKTGF